jgi:hypothetical protein
MLFVGDDWAEDHHDVEVQDQDGRRLARARLPEGIAGLTRLHELLAEHLDEDDVDPTSGFVAQNVVVGIETDRGTWVTALSPVGTPGGSLPTGCEHLLRSLPYAGREDARYFGAPADGGRERSH